MNLTNKLSKLPSKNSYIMGDYNINMLDLNTKDQAGCIRKL